MSNAVINLVYQKALGSTVRKAILVYMADKASDDGGGIWPSKATIAAATEIGRSTVFREIGELVAEGILIEAGHHPCQGGATTVYAIDLEHVASLPDVKPVKGETRPTAGPVPQRDPSSSGTPPVPQRDPHPSRSGTQTILEPSINQVLPLVPQEKTASKRKRRSQLPEGWVPSEKNIQDAKALGFTESEIGNEAGRFRDHHHAKGTIFSDCDAGWRRWIDKAIEIAARGGGADETSSAARLAYERILAKEANGGGADEASSAAQRTYERILAKEENR